METWPMRERMAHMSEYEAHVAHVSACVTHTRAIHACRELMGEIYTFQAAPTNVNMGAVVCGALPGCPTWMQLVDAMKASVWE